MVCAFTCTWLPPLSSSSLSTSSRALGAMALLILVWVCALLTPSYGMGINWGTQASHPLPPSIVVQLLKSNNISKVKLFDSDETTLKALAGSDIEVMVAIPNNMLQDMADDSSTATSWVEDNVSKYIFEGGVNIKYVAVGNEPFLKSYNGNFTNITFPALQNIQNALNNANLGDQIKSTVPMNGDVLADSTLPSEGTFRNDSSQQVAQILTLLQQNNCPFTINIYPFLSLADNANFPLNYVYFNSSVVQVQDGTKAYTNTFDASYDTLVAALTSAGYPDMPIIIGEIGWPTDGISSATPANAQMFNQGFLNHVQGNGGTPSRPNTSIEYYLFGLLDEDQKSIAPGNFERHWGIFAYDGTTKYSLSVPGTMTNTSSNSSGTLVNATGVEYLQRQWCVVATNADVNNLVDSVSYACTYADCTELGYGGSCNGVLDAKGNASYAFNQYYQLNSQDSGSCNFDGLATVTETDPSVGDCKFIVQIVATSTAPRQRVNTITIVLALALVCISYFMMA